MSNRDGIQMTVFGMKGSGKSKFTMESIKGVSRLIVFDPKRSYRKEPGFKVIEKLPVLLASLKENSEKFRIAYQPEPGNEETELHNVCMLIERLQRPYLDEVSADKVMIVVEEAHTAAPNKSVVNLAKNGFNRVVTMGRESGIDIITVTQRPQSIAMYIRDNVDRVASFQVAGLPAVEAAARTIVTAKMGVQDAIAGLQKYYFVFAENGEWEVRNPIKI